MSEYITNVKIQRNEKIKQVVSDDGVILKDLRYGTHYTGNKVACSIWQMIENPISFEELLDELKKRYIVEETHFDEDIMDFLNYLHEKKLILYKFGIPSSLN